MNQNDKPDRVTDFDDDIPTYTAADKERTAAEQAQAAEEAAKQATDKGTDSKSRPGGPVSHEPTETMPAVRPPQSAEDSVVGEAEETVSFDRPADNPVVGEHDPGLFPNAPLEDELADSAAPAEATTQGSEDREEAAKAEKKPRSPYERYKRAAPQTIPAASAFNRTPETIEPASNATDADYDSHSDYGSEPTTVLERDLRDLGYEDVDLADPAPAAAKRRPPRTARESYAEPTTELPRDAALTDYAEPAPETQAFNRDEYADDYASEADREAAAAGLVAIEKPARGTIDFGLFLLRLVVSAWLIWDALVVFFALGSHGGIGVLEADYAMHGYAQAHLLSIAVPALELTAGLFLLVGVLSPFASALAVIASGWNLLHTVHTSTIDIWNLDGKVLFAALLFAVAVVLQFTGAGRISVDTNRSWVNRPLASGWIFLILALAGVAALWYFGAGVTPSI